MQASRGLEQRQQKEYGGSCLDILQSPMVRCSCLASRVPPPPQLAWSRKKSALHYRPFWSGLYGTRRHVVLEEHPCFCSIGMLQLMLYAKVSHVWDSR